jgi:DNA polymerase III subunit chi
VVSVDFHVLAEDSPDARMRYACRLAEQAVEQAQRVYMHVPASEVHRLDELLWTFNDRAFLPHEVFGGGEANVHARVMILLGDRAGPATHRQLLINLADALPPQLEDYERIAEIVEVDPERKRAARERYKQYRERGCTLNTVEV